jgi:hypothetical protein
MGVGHVNDIVEFLSASRRARTSSKLGDEEWNAKGVSLSRSGSDEVFYIFLTILQTSS